MPWTLFQEALTHWHRSGMMSTCVVTTAGDSLLNHSHFWDFPWLHSPYFSLSSPGQCLDWIRRQTWCTWKWGPQMDVSAAVGPTVPDTCIRALSNPDLHVNGSGRWKASSSLTAIPIPISQSRGIDSRSQEGLSLKWTPRNGLSGRGEWVNVMHCASASNFLVIFEG